jgi:hypothetical protein
MYNTHYLSLMLINSIIIEMNVQGDDYKWFEMPSLHILKALLFELHPAQTGTFSNIKQVMCKNMVFLGSPYNISDRRTT